MDKAQSLSDLARYLGLSPATVSRALAQHDAIAPQTRARVAKAAQELGYVPNRAAQALASGRSGFVGFLLPMRGRGLADPFLGAFVSGLTEGFAAQNVELLLSAVPKDGSELRQLDKLITAGRVEGMVLSRIERDDPRVALLRTRRVPFVAHGRTGEGPATYSWLDTDGRAAFAEAFARLYDLGHRRFGILSIREPLTFRFEREEGLRAAHASKGDPTLSLRHVACARYDAEGRARAIAEMLNGPARPTAVLAVSDGLALDLIAAAQALGLSVPGDLSVIGFDNMPSAARVTPGLTTFDARIAETATELAAMLLARIAAPDQPHLSRLLTPQLVLRQSHGPAPPA